jgi:threonine/homoserine/homoserine lactone efflux protein
MPAPAFTGGFLLAIANPKAYLAIAAVFAGATLLPADHALDAAIKTTVLGLMIGLIHLGWLAAGASLGRLLRDPLWSRVINIGLAIALVGSTVAGFIGGSF